MTRANPKQSMTLKARSGGTAPTRSRVRGLVILLRPGQWTKNLLVFAGLIFGRELFNPASVVQAMEAFVLFCGLSGVIYLLNDYADREADRKHPLKATRPIAAGVVSPRLALITAVVLGILCLAGSFWLNWRFGVVAVSYAALLSLYSGALKHIVIIDVLTIAIGFVLRAVAGAVAVGVPISQWLLTCTILLALFIALSKRRHEIVLLANEAASHRPILGEYSPYLLDQMIAVVTASTLMAYAFYAVSPETVEKFGTQNLGLTLPFPLYGIFRYLYLVHQKDGGGSPAELLATDRPLLLCVALWVVAVVLIIYHPFGF